MGCGKGDWKDSSLVLVRSNCFFFDSPGTAGAYGSLSVGGCLGTTAVVIVLVVIVNQVSKLGLAYVAFQVSIQVVLSVRESN